MAPVMLVTALVAVGQGPQGAHAAQPLQGAVAVVPHVVFDDYGGSVRDRYYTIRALRRAGRPVEIRGKVCYSSCTMMLGLKDICVRPETVFGFHGPSRWGAPLPRDQFDRASRIIASQYPPALRSWYMNKARFTLSGLHLRTGAELIAMGLVSRCDDAAEVIRPSDQKPS